MAISDLKISTKLYVSFLTITFILLLNGFINYSNIKTLTHKTEEILQTAPLIDAAMEMKLAVATDMQLVMELLASETPADLDDVWLEHQEMVTKFDLFADAILNGATTDEGIIFATKDVILQKIVTQADSFHNNEFQPAMQSVYDGSKSIFQLKIKRHESMRAMEAAFDKIISQAEELEAAIKIRIEKRINNGATAESIIYKESTWADISMEIKTTIALTRIVIEEYAQDAETANRAELLASYSSFINDFDNWIKALLNGAQTSEGKIAKITDDHLQQLVEQIDQSHDKSFQVAIDTFMDSHNVLSKAIAERSTADKSADEIGIKMKTILGEIEDVAKEDMAIAGQDSTDTAASSIMTTIICVVLGGGIASLFALVIPPSISRPLGCEPKEIQEIAERIARGDLTNNFDKANIDNATGVYAAIIEMNSKLQYLVGELVKSSGILASTATETSAISEQTNIAIQEQAQQTDLVATAVEQMSATINEVAHISTETAAAATESERETEQGKKNIDKTISAIGGLSGEINHASDVIISLQEECQSIGTISDVISSIADQTNLLALNAAIEAARAGEQGRGFAVVADEVRSLASKTQESITSINTIITSLQSKSISAVDVMKSNQTRITETIGLAKKSGDELAHISQMNIQINDMTAQIATAVEEQSVVTSEISINVQQISNISHQTSTGANETVKASEMLAEQAETLKELAETFKI